MPFIRSVARGTRTLCLAWPLLLLQFQSTIEQAQKARVESLPPLALDESEPLVLPGVVIEEIPEDSALKRAGLQPGDVILSWERLPNPPTNPEGASGTIENPFDWMWVEIEQAPRGVVRLQVVQATGARSIEMLLEPVSIRVRPLYLCATEGSMPPANEATLPPAHLEETRLENSARQAKRSTYLTACWQTLQRADFSPCLRDWSPPENSCGLSKSSGHGQVDLGAETLITLKWAKEAQVPNSPKLQALQALLQRLPTNTLLRGAVEEALGNLLLQAGDLGRAETAHQQAREIRAVEAPGSLILAESIEDLGNVSHDRAQYQLSSALHQEALDIRRRLAPGSSLEAKSLGNLGGVALETGQIEKAERLITRVYEIFSRVAPRSRNQANTLHNMATISVLRGNLQAAEKYYLTALEIEGNIDPAGAKLIDIRYNLGNLYFEQSRFVDASEMFLRALDLYRKSGWESLILARILNGLGNVAFQRSDVDAADEYYREALSAAEQIEPSGVESAKCLQNIALVALKRGQIPLSQTLLEQALTLYRQFARGTRSEAGLLRHLGVVFDLEGKRNEARRLYHAALTVIESSLGRNSPERANILEDIAILQADAGVFADAERLNLEAMRIHQLASGDSVQLTLIYIRLGTLAFQGRRLEEARAYFNRVLSLVPKISVGYSPDESMALYWLGRVASETGKESEARALWLRAIDALERYEDRLGLNHLSPVARPQRDRSFYRDLIRLLVNGGDTMDAFAIVERHKARLLLHETAERDVLDFLETEASESGLQGVSKSGQDCEDIGIMRHSTSLEKPLFATPSNGSDSSLLLEDERAARIARIRRNQPRLAALRFPEPLSGFGARENLDAGSVLISYFSGSEETFIFSIPAKGTTTVSIAPVNEKTLRQRVERFRELLSLARPGSQIGELRIAELRQLGKELYDLLLMPAEAEIEKAARVMIVADGPLHYLPFAALTREVLGEDGIRRDEYLAEWKPFHSVLSATLFTELKKGRRDPAKHEDGAAFEFMAFGDPVYPTSVTIKEPDKIVDIRVRSAARRGGLDLARLPYTRREIEGIAALFPSDRVRTLLGTEATEEKVKAIGKGSRILHFATHARLDDRFPLNSSLVLSMPEGFPKDHENGLLQVWEIFESVRLDADLVVLSACDSGLGEEQGGEGLIGLTRAFQFAGARTVIASLWEVRDEATAELMIRFYRHLTSGQPKDQALQAAQRELLAGPIEIPGPDGETILFDATAPYYWAAFQVIGDWK